MERACSLLGHHGAMAAVTGATGAGRHAGHSTDAIGYPGRMLDEPGLLGPFGVRPWSGDAARMLDDRVPVLAVGSNGDPSVLRRKLVARDASPVVPLVPVVVIGLSVAHSAHVSLAGVVAAAPRDDPTGAVRGVMTWLDAAQLAVVDTTEPNYQRVRLAEGRYVCATTVPTPAMPVSVYRSVWGLLAPDGVRPVPLGTQERLHRLLAADPAVSARLPLHDAAATVRLLTQQRYQVWLRTHWARAGRTAPDGLATDPHVEPVAAGQLQPLVDPHPSQT